jgi:MoxR-like ATPase
MSPSFTGTDAYIVSDELARAVDVAVAIGRPLLIKGEPGTGKTLLAVALAQALGHDLLRWQVKSTTKAVDGLYQYDTVRRLHDSRFGEGSVSDIGKYIDLGPLGQAFAAEERTVVLIDEIDKADPEFPNDLLHELDMMSFSIPETGETITAQQRPVVVITSNNEKELPDAFLRRCVFHWIEFPDRDLMARIVRVHHPKLEDELLGAALEKFYSLRAVDGLRKPPSTSELIDWISALRHSGMDPAKLLGAGLPFLGVLLKKEQDVEQVERRVRKGTWGAGRG